MFDKKPPVAPEFTGITDWINSGPLTIAELKGKIILIDFWTYSCINCIRTQPYLNAWYDTYKKYGFEIIGVHAPEFEFEKMLDNVRRAVADEKIMYPVALDNSYGTWNAYDNHYWPAKYLIDQDGRIQFTHFGEGAYDETEKAIQTLLQKNDHIVAEKIGAAHENQSFQHEQTAETYLGYERGSSFANASEFAADTSADYTLAEDLDEGQWSLGGRWRIGAMETTALGETNVLRISFSAKEVYLVMDGPKNTALTLRINGKAVTSTINGGQDVAAGGRVQLDGARLYRLVTLPVFTQDAILDITIPQGVTVNAFTFGS